MRHLRFFLWWFSISQVGLAAMPEGPFWRRVVATVLMGAAGVIYVEWLRSLEWSK